MPPAAEGKVKLAGANKALRLTLSLLWKPSLHCFVPLVHRWVISCVSPRSVSRTQGVNEDTSCVGSGPRSGHASARRGAGWETSVWQFHKGHTDTEKDTQMNVHTHPQKHTTTLYTSLHVYFPIGRRKDMEIRQAMSSQGHNVPNVV